MGEAPMKASLQIRENQALLSRNLTSTLFPITQIPKAHSYIEKPMSASSVTRCLHVSCAVDEPSHKVKAEKQTVFA